ncbi:response regulator, partial [Candidatus Woesearchaeota archaeon]|nr:response regulator [Candidatus Woesearchaeota archaeon]
LAADGLEGLAKAREIHPDLIISDTDMPKMSGPDFLDAYKAERSDARAILMSGKGLEDICDRYPSAAKYVFLRKPFTVKEFRSAFDEATQTS